ncbi:hypothetical protein EIN_023470 [Entamoeba invadens IP1]|uniref:hypothetical protein n=1 Tax=Entamoeba invadens IP1 TaxID=370355 RepID=UPI0002C3E6B1|nr:hypothetical protein EIN_023470 [Entamoeba invadens IP1]ELP90658.1 hypothetical protein EIN_023470 [Entamoeba invadens IP1]|eukprot:XP_004257429.1 hypothetical protein EIN_023470 [Entamoeba invadens IP1]
MTHAASVFDEYNERSKTAQRELLIEKLKRQKSIRLIGKISGSALTYNDIVRGLISQNDKECEDELTDKRIAQLLSEKNKETEVKRMEFLRRLAQKEIDNDQSQIANLLHEKVISGSATDLNAISDNMQRKWKLQRRALNLLERARTSKIEAVTFKVKSQKEPNAQYSKLAGYNLRLTQRRDKIAQKAIMKAIAASQVIQNLIVLKEAEMKNSALENAKNILKRTNRRFKKFNINDKLF